MKRLIIGCGYLGLPVGRRWVESGDQVWAMTRSRARWNELETAGLQPLLGDVTQPETLTQLPSVDTVLFAVGMDRSRYSDIRAVYVEGLQNVLQHLPVDTGHFIYISSTGVYGELNGAWADEETPTQPTREGGRACLEAETLIRESLFAERATILRFAGIYGPTRIPFQSAIKSKQWDKLSSDGHLNLIHVEDGARVIDAVANKRPFYETILVSDGKPVERKLFYEAAARALTGNSIDWPINAPVPARGRSDKKISNRKLQKLFPISFLYPDYQSGLVGCCTQK